MRYSIGFIFLVGCMVFTGPAYAVSVDENRVGDDWRVGPKPRTGGPRPGGPITPIKKESVLAYIKVTKAKGGNVYVVSVKEAKDSLEFQKKLSEFAKNKDGVMNLSNQEFLKYMVEADVISREDAGKLSSKDVKDVILSEKDEVEVSDAFYKAVELKEREDSSKKVEGVKESLRLP